MENVTKDAAKRKTADTAKCRASDAAERKMADAAEFKAKMCDGRCLAVQRE